MARASDYQFYKAGRQRTEACQGGVALCAIASGLCLSILAAAVPAAALTPPADSDSQAPAATNADIGPSVTAVLHNVVRYVQVRDILAQEEVEIGRQINQRLLAHPHSLYEGVVINQYVNQIGQGLVAVSHPRDISYTFQVLESDRIDAFSAPGGFVYVTTGLLQAVANEAQLAAVLSREIAHVNQRHNLQTLKRWAAEQGAADDAHIDLATLAEMGYQLAVNRPYNSEFELEADRIGLSILRDAGYPQMAFVTLLEQLEDSSIAPEFLPSSLSQQSRIEALRRQIQAAEGVPYLGLNLIEYQQRILPLVRSSQSL
ncbi:MAG: M48 family metalloprotease [Cyanobacteria bacterium Co-bin13]|nr:M48 family metalloprotease [Cyanobacteria bacterium Co-bin13]